MNKKWSYIRSKILRVLWGICILTLCAIPVFEKNPFNYNCYAQIIPSSELIINAKEYNKKTVLYEGEVIGDVMKRQGGAWVNISDGEQAIGVWLVPELVNMPQYRGNYKAQGDIVQVKGVFNSVCSMHGGDLDIHAVSLDIIKQGWYKQEGVITAKRNIVVILTVVLCLILILRILITK